MNQKSDENSSVTVELPGAIVWSGRQAIERQVSWPGPLNTPLGIAGFDAAQHEIQQWAGYAETPLVDLPAMAHAHGISRLAYKDEGERFTLKSFKALGGAYAVQRLLVEAIHAQQPDATVTTQALLDRQFQSITEQMTVTCATDGNHGRSVAWGAQQFGCRCVIYIHETVSEGRREAIAHYGAEVIRVDGNYDDAVRHAAQAASSNGWTVVSDTSYEGYTDIPADVMHGYGVMAREVTSQWAGAPPTHVFVQAGVGAFAAAVCAVFWQHWGAQRPVFVLVEPSNAACCYESLKAGERVTIPGELDTIMAGLACGEVSLLAWEVLRLGVDACVVLDDEPVRHAMRQFARPPGSDKPIVSGETGAAGLAALSMIAASEKAREAICLIPGARILLLGSEGDTDPALYEEIVGANTGASVDSPQSRRLS
ncbi:MAG: diaminopropionate ammonia-lyase [Burkholderiaceae bacterium]